MIPTNFTIPAYIAGGSTSRYLVTGVRYQIEFAGGSYFGKFIGAKVLNESVWLYFELGPYNNETGFEANEIDNIEVA